MLQLKNFLFSSSLIALSLTACQKPNEDSAETFSISGNLYSDCNYEPEAFMELELYQAGGKDPFGGTTGGLLDKTVTDEKGYFKFSFGDKKGEYQIIRVPGGFSSAKLVEYIPTKTNFNSLEVLLKARANISVYLEVENSYGSSDTLHYFNLNTGEFEELVGPFENGYLYTATMLEVANVSYPVTEGFVSYYLNQYNGNSYACYQVETFCRDTAKAVIRLK